jgi:hypothetical protein
MQKVYLLRLMPICIGLIKLAAYFVIPPNRKWSLIIVHRQKWIGLILVLRYEWLELYWSFSSGIDIKFAQSFSQ